MKKVIIKKVKPVKPRNNASMTEAAFFQWLRQILRKSSIHWKPIAQARKDAQVVYRGTNKRRRFSYVCSVCRKEFAGTDIRVHHKSECGTLKSFDDLPLFCERLFCEKEGLAVVCNSCHDNIHNKETK